MTNPKTTIPPGVSLSVAMDVAREQADADRSPGETSIEDALRLDLQRRDQEIAEMRDELEHIHRDRREGAPMADLRRTRIALEVTALVELHRANHGTTRYDNRFLALATKLGDALCAEHAPGT